MDVRRVHHDVARSTHTPELNQLREINEQLGVAAQAGRPVTAADLGLGGADVDRVIGGGGVPALTLPADAPLEHLVGEGPPDFPYIVGHFTGGAGTTLVVDVHTAELRTLSQRFHLRHVWGA